MLKTWEGVILEVKFPTSGKIDGKSVDSANDDFSLELHMKSYDLGVKVTKYFWAVYIFRSPSKRSVWGFDSQIC